MQKKRLPFSSYRVNLGQINKRLMKLRTFFIVIAGSLLLVNCGGKRGEGIIGEIIHVNGELPEETESIDLFWTINSQPDASKLSMKTLEFSKDKSKMSFTPDAAGKYVFEMEIFQYGDELETQKFTYNVDSIEPLVTSETEDEALAEEEDKDWLEEEYKEELEYDEDEDYDYAEESEEDEDYDYAEESEDDEEQDYDYAKESMDNEVKDEEIEETEIAAAEITPPKVAPKSTAAKPAKKKSPRYIIPFDKSRYTIQVVSKKNLKDAERTAANLIESGYDAYIQKAYFRDTDEVWFRVRVGSYDNRETALAVGKVIASAMTTDIWVDFVRFED
jgi:cell division protein FtsN